MYVVDFLNSNLTVFRGIKFIQKLIQLIQNDISLFQKKYILNSIELISESSLTVSSSGDIQQFNILDSFIGENCVKHKWPTKVKFNNFDLTKAFE